METYLNPIDQERQAKLNLLILDDDNIDFLQRESRQEKQNWKKSLKTQNQLRDKLTQRYKNKRKSQQQSRLKSILNKENHTNLPLPSNKQSLKDLLRKLDSKQTHDNTLKNSSVTECDRFSIGIKNNQMNYSNRTTIEQPQTDNRSLRKRSKQCSSQIENNFISKKIEISSAKKINKFNEEPMTSIQNNFNVNCNYEMCKKRQFLTECKPRNPRRAIMLKSTHNKENQLIEFVDLPLNNLTGIQKSKNTIFINKQKSQTNWMEKEEMNKKTFQILQEINRNKTINNVNKLASQSLKLKKSQLRPYSRALKDKNNFTQEHYRSKSRIFIKNNENVWTKLQIRK